MQEKTPNRAGAGKEVLKTKDAYDDWHFHMMSFSRYCYLAQRCWIILIFDDNAIKLSNLLSAFCKS